ncbi:MAG TPA: cupredoxin domain-containing protein [Dongiaceae bacterium]
MTPVATPGAGSAAWSRRTFLGALALAAFVRPVRADGATVEIHQLKFTPAEIEVAAGSTVTFVNLDLVPHTATGASFDTGTLTKDQRKEIQFPTAGEFPYFCKFHRHMTGKVVVR